MKKQYVKGSTDLESKLDKLLYDIGEAIELAVDASLETDNSRDFDKLVEIQDRLEAAESGVSTLLASLDTRRRNDEERRRQS